jgi:hypothetical protein
VRFSGSKKERQLSAGPVLLKAKRGPKKAIMAVVASILTAIFHMLKDGTMYHDLGLRPLQAPLHRPAKKSAYLKAWPILAMP